MGEDEYFKKLEEEQKKKTGQAVKRALAGPILVGGEDENARPNPAAGGQAAPRVNGASLLAAESGPYAQGGFFARDQALTKPLSAENRQVPSLWGRLSPAGASPVSQRPLERESVRSLSRPLSPQVAAELKAKPSAFMVKAEPRRGNTPPQFSGG